MTPSVATIVVCVKWVDLHPDIDALTGAVTTDDRRRGFSDSDQAALEVGLRLAERTGAKVAVVNVGPSGATEALRLLAASGASWVEQIPTDREPLSSVVGATLASVVQGMDDVDLVITGDHSLDRGSGSVPSYVAHHLQWPQALGLVDVAEDGRGGVRRLDGGRREHVRWGGAAVISVEGSVARLRRASLRQVLDADKLPGHPAMTDSTGAVVGAVIAAPEFGPTEPLRPRARTFPAPPGDTARARIVELTGALVERTPPRRVEAEPAQAAVEIVDQLRAWGYVD